MTISDTIGGFVLNSYNAIDALIPAPYKPALTLGIFIILITIYGIFVWKFYRFLAKRDLLHLNLSKYNKYEQSFVKKAFGMLLFIVEYAIILPVVVFFWFFVIATILLFLAKEQSASNILLISAVLVGAVRISAYYNEDLSKDIAKMFPFTILTVAILTPNFFSVTDTIAKVNQVGDLFNNVVFFLFVIIALEFILRILYLLMPHFEEDEAEKAPLSNGTDLKTS